MIYRTFLCFTDSYSGSVRDYLREQIAFLKSRNSSCLLVTSCQGRHALDDGFAGLLCLADVTSECGEKAVKSHLKRLHSFAQRYKPDIVHSHANQNTLFAGLLAGQLRLPMICTCHGTGGSAAMPRGGLSHLCKQLRATASITFVLSPHSLDLQRAEIGAENGVVLPVPIKLPARRLTGNDHERLCRWCWSGDMSKETLPGLLALIGLAQRIDLGTLDLFGDGVARETVVNWLAQIEPKTSITWRGAERPSKAWPLDYGVACGSGRNALESLAAGLPTLLVGQGGLHGFIDRDTIADFAYSNFDGINCAKVTARRLAAQLLDLGFDPQRFDMTDWVRENHRDELVWQAFEGLVDARAAPPIIDLDGLAHFFTAGSGLPKANWSLTKRLHDLARGITAQSSQAA